jgi:hypothetical protein
MMDDRTTRWGSRDDYYRGGNAPDYTEDYGSGRDYTYSSAREYAAAGELDPDRARYGYGRRGREHRDDWRARSEYPRNEYPRSEYRSRDWDRGAWDRDRYQRGSDRGYGGRYDDRGFLERAGDEVRSWFGDEDAERRRERDQRYDERMGRQERWREAGGRDDHYTGWRRQRIAELDRDYDEYRRENAQRFHSEFETWRTDRQSQRDCLRRVTEHMEVLGSDGSHVGTVDKVRGDRIILTKSDTDAGGRHHSIPSRWIDSVDDKVKLRKTADEAKAHWRDEERSGAFFGETRNKPRDPDRQDWSSEHNLNRSFSGTY